MDQSCQQINYFDYGFICAVEVMYHIEDDDDEAEYKPSDVYTCIQREESLAMLVEVYNDVKQNGDIITIIIKVIEDRPIMPSFPTMNYPILFSKFESWLKQLKIIE